MRAVNEEKLGNARKLVLDAQKLLMGGLEESSPGEFLEVVQEAVQMLGGGLTLIDHAQDPDLLEDAEGGDSGGDQPVDADGAISAVFHNMIDTKSDLLGIQVNTIAERAAKRMIRRWVYSDARLLEDEEGKDD